MRVILIIAGLGLASVAGFIAGCVAIGKSVREAIADAVARGLNF